MAEQLKGLPLLGDDQKRPLHAEVNKLDWTQGVGPEDEADAAPRRRRPSRGPVAEVSPRRRGAVQPQAAGGRASARRRWPRASTCRRARSCWPSLVKGPFGKQKLIDASTAHQIFGRAGRPQFDDRGYVFALAHEDDVKILRWKEKYDQIPENTSDPGLLKAKKALKRKKPTRRETRGLLERGRSSSSCKAAPPGKLYSKGPLPWRLLAYLLKMSPEVSQVRDVLRKRLMDEPRIEASAEGTSTSMLLTLAAGGFVTLDPRARLTGRTPRMQPAGETPLCARPGHADAGARQAARLPQRSSALRGVSAQPARHRRSRRAAPGDGERAGDAAAAAAVRARAVAGRAAARPAGDDAARRGADPPRPDDRQASAQPARKRKKTTVDGRGRRAAADAWPRSCGCCSTRSIPTWRTCTRNRSGRRASCCASTATSTCTCKSRDLVKQEGIVFRHLLRLILLCGEFAQVSPPTRAAETGRRTCATWPTG